MEPNMISNIKLEGNVRKNYFNDNYLKIIKIKLEQQDLIDSRSIFVQNFSTKMTKKMLENIFSKVGELKNVSILYDKYTGLSKGYAYIEFKDVATVARAIYLFNGKKIDRKRIRVTEKKKLMESLEKKNKCNLKSINKNLKKKIYSKCKFSFFR